MQYRFIGVNYLRSTGEKKECPAVIQDIFQGLFECQFIHLLVLLLCNIGWEDDIDISAKVVGVIDLRTGRVLWTVFTLMNTLIGDHLVLVNDIFHLCDMFSSKFRIYRIYIHLKKFLLCIPKNVQCFCIGVEIGQSLGINDIDLIDGIFN